MRPWCQAIKPRVNHRPRPCSNHQCKDLVLVGPGPCPIRFSRSKREVKGTHPGFTAAPWLAVARGPERPHATRQVAEHKTSIPRPGVTKARAAQDSDSDPAMET